MSPTTNVLILGATGKNDCSASVFVSLLSQVTLAEAFYFVLLSDLKVTALVRSADKAQKLKTIIHDANVVEGTPADASLLKELLKDTDVIIDTYSSDDMYQATGKKTEVIHVSGAFMIADDARGMDVPSKVYDDADVEEMANIPEERLHRNVDLEFLKAETEGYITVYLVIPAAVFGDVSTALVDAGIQKSNAAVFTLSIRPVFTFKGVVATIGEGRNRWSIVHIDDLTDLMMIIFDKVLKKEHVPHGKEGYYFAENGEIAARRVVEIAAQTYKTIRGEDAQKIEKRPLTKAELDIFFPGEMARANTRCVGTRGRKLGWAPTRGVEAAEKWVEETSRAIALSQ
ncbi:hypothetical protein BDZ89DRAFT_1059987 [Hymenopellis radicata]|nr:hypothetical protein BDZ89DRAFT_1059987 [Hymenopellis radicata]